MLSKRQLNDKIIIDYLDKNEAIFSKKILKFKVILDKSFQRTGFKITEINVSIGIFFTTFLLLI